MVRKSHRGIAWASWYEAWPHECGRSTCGFCTQPQHIVPTVDCQAGGINFSCGRAIRGWLCGIPPAGSNPSGLPARAVSISATPALALIPPNPARRAAGPGAMKLHPAQPGACLIGGRQGTLRSSALTEPTPSAHHPGGPQRGAQGVQPGARPASRADVGGAVRR